MGIYSVTYDLIKTKDYDKLYDAIKALPGTYTRATESQWLLDTKLTTAEIRDKLQDYVDGDDKILVLRISDWKSLHLSKNLIDPKVNPVDWLKARKGSF